MIQINLYLKIIRLGRGARFKSIRKRACEGTHFLRERGNRRRKKKPKTSFWYDAEDAAYCHILWSAIGKLEFLCHGYARIYGFLYLRKKAENPVKERERKKE